MDILTDVFDIVFCIIEYFKTHRSFYQLLALLQLHWFFHMKLTILNNFEKCY